MKYIIGLSIYHQTFGHLVKDVSQRIGHPNTYERNVAKGRRMYKRGIRERDKDVLARGEWCIWEGIFEKILNNKEL